MYQRAFTKMLDEDVQLHFMNKYNFGMLISQNPIEITHLPFYTRKELEKWYIYGHFAKANSHWKKLNKSEVKVVFNGPHGYISPRNYENPDVPTWNYSSVHVSGTLTIIDEPQRHWSIIQELVNIMKTIRQCGQ